jgi:hypothetical protein
MEPDLNAGEGIPVIEEGYGIDAFAAATTDAEIEQWLRNPPEAEIVFSGSREAAVQNIADAIKPASMSLTNAETAAMTAWVVTLQEIAFLRDSETDFLAITDRPEAPEGTTYARWSHLCRRILSRMAESPKEPPREVVRAIEAALRTRIVQFLEIHDGAARELKGLAGRIAGTVTALADAKKLDSERIDALVTAVDKLLAKCDAPVSVSEQPAADYAKLAADHAELVANHVKLVGDYGIVKTNRKALADKLALLDLPLLQLFRAWLARRLSRH